MVAPFEVGNEDILFPFVGQSARVALR